MIEKKDGAVANEVERRLDDLFGESGESLLSVEYSSDLEGSPLGELKAIVLSIDWEITDEVMTKLIQQTDRLKNIYGDDKILLLFLQLLGSTGKYIKANKAKAHPEAANVLNSAYTGLEKVVLSKGITEAERKKILFAEVKRFKKLKEKIALRKAEKAREIEIGPVQEIRPEIVEHEEDADVQEESRPPAEAKEELLPSEVKGMPPHEAFVYALEEIKQVIKSEFKALRAELKLWRETQ